MDKQTSIMFKDRSLRTLWINSTIVSERYDTLTGVWSSCPTMSTRRRYCRLAVVDNCIFALGGFDSSNYQASVEKFDPRYVHGPLVRVQNSLSNWIYCCWFSVSDAGWLCHRWQADEVAVELPHLMAICTASEETMAPCACQVVRVLWSIILGTVPVTLRILFRDLFNAIASINWFTGERFNVRRNAWEPITAMHSRR